MKIPIVNEIIDLLAFMFPPDSPQFPAFVIVMTGLTAIIILWKYDKMQKQAYYTEKRIYRFIEWIKRLLK